MTQIKHEYECRLHGRFDYSVPFGESPPKTRKCPASMVVAQRMCKQRSPWVPPTVGVIWGGGFIKT